MLTTLNNFWYREFTRTPTIVVLLEGTDMEKEGAQVGFARIAARQCFQHVWRCVELMVHNKLVTLYQKCVKDYQDST